MEPLGRLNGDNSPKEASEATRAADQKLRDTLPFDDTADFDDAKRNLIACPDTLTITNADGEVVWDMEQFKTYIAEGKDAPGTVNPSLWRNAQLCMNYGLFQVTDRIYQVRGYDLSNITFIEGDTGWIVFDTLDQSKIELDGDRGAVTEFVGLLDDFPLWFNIVTP